MGWNGRRIRRPRPYATVHIPVVVSRHPLWDDFDEAYDPENERVLDQARLTPTTTVLDAEPAGHRHHSRGTLLPLCSQSRMFVFFFALVFQWLWVALAAFRRYLPAWLFLDVAMPRPRRLLWNSAVQIPQRQVMELIDASASTSVAAYYGMCCVIVTEFMLFVCMFSAYFYLGTNKNRWAADAPEAMYAVIMLVDSAEPAASY